MSVTHTQDRRVGVGEAARIAGLAPDTIRRAADSGKLPHNRTPGGQRRFLISDVEALVTNPVAGAPTADGPQVGEATPTASPTIPSGEGV